jgi:mono/diheme cytochrome c family protein
MSLNNFHSVKFWSLVILAAAGTSALFHAPLESRAARSNPQAPTAPLDTNSPVIQAAARLFQGKSCAGCHFLRGIWCCNGIPLDHAAKKYDEATLRRFIRNPKSVDPQSLMPAQKMVTDSDIDAMASFLSCHPTAKNNSPATHDHH